MGRRAKIALANQEPILAGQTATKTEFVVCCLCGSADSELLFSTRDYRFGSKEPYHIWRCCSCGMIYLNPRPTAEAIAKLYREAYTPDGRVRVSDSGLRRRLRPYSYAWSGYYFPELPSEQKVLDLGCGDGRLLEVLQGRGCDVHGIEINSKLAQISEQRGIPVFVGTLEDASFPDETFEVVIMSQIIEHLPSPRQTLEEVWRILRPGGRVLLLCPNAESYLLKIFGKYWHGWHVPFHFYFFTENVVQKLAEETGFRPTMDTITPVGGVIVSLKSWLYGEQSRRPVDEAKVLDTLIFQVLLFPLVRLPEIVRRKWGDNLRVTLVKRER